MLHSNTRSSLDKIQFFHKAEGAKRMIHSSTESRGLFTPVANGHYSEAIKVPRRSVYEHCIEPTHIDFSFLDKCRKPVAA